MLRWKTRRVNAVSVKIADGKLSALISVKSVRTVEPQRRRTHHIRQIGLFQQSLFDLHGSVKAEVYVIRVVLSGYGFLEIEYLQELNFLHSCCNVDQNLTFLTTVSFIAI